MEPNSIAKLIEETFGIEPRAALWLTLGVIILAGLVAWAVTKFVERKNTRDIERLRSELDAQVRKTQVFLDTSTHVRRAQFEVEFRAYQEIWGAVATVRSAIFHVRRPSETSEARQFGWIDDYWRDVFESWEEANDALFTVVDRSAPFYPNDLFRQLLELQQHSDTVQGYFASQWDQSRKNREEYVPNSSDAAEVLREGNEVVKSIRIRLENMKVVD